MPTVLRIKGYKFKIYSNENDEAPHVHIAKAGGNAKYWLVPEIAEEYSYGFTVRERRDIKILIRFNHALLLKAWYENFE